MSTTDFNQSNKTGKKIAGAAAAAAAVGGVAAASGSFNGSENEDLQVEEEQTETQTETQAEAKPESELQANTSTQTTTENAAEEESVVGETDDEESTIDGETVDPDGESGDVTNSESGDVTNSESGDVTNSELEGTDTIDVDPVDDDYIEDNIDVTIEADPILDEENPDLIADALIAEEQIDANDIDAQDIINFDQIGTVYTVEGDAYTAASFHDPNGNELLMVDVDGDDIFDVITTTDGDIIADAGGLTLSDAELMISEDGTYLAAGEDTPDVLPDGDSFLDDIITT